MAIIDNCYFKGELLIPNANETGAPVGVYLNALVPGFEEDLLRQVLGHELYEQFIAWYNATPDDTESKWAKILKGVSFQGGKLDFRLYWNGFKSNNSPIAQYCYYQFKKIDATQSVDGGEVHTNSQNASNASPLRKMVTIWNKMVDQLCTLKMYMDSSDDFKTDEDWILQSKYACLNEVYKKVNAFGI
ncbi:hypothetical protein [Rhizosphaericola mali]|uniref:Uncharacterized protein n=1 Tax=Rhizosphaericola mali TaxID=2545455 RepID=A0A5P2G521_9BACT|nr:hypothetical protein [Rhizosphaericola mali]QES88860.1 hypothetical protein E0W69_009400 [Rhizosphaericola mali]